MRRVFRRKKNMGYDGDEDFIHFMEDFMLRKSNVVGDLMRFKEDYKITIIIEKEKKLPTRRQPTSKIGFSTYPSKPIVHKVFNSGQLVKKEGSSVLIKVPRYLCNQAVDTTKSKSSFQWKKVTCKNCLRKYNKKGWEK